MAVQKKSLIGNRTTVKKAIIAKAGSKAELAPNKVAPAKTAALKPHPVKYTPLQISPSKVL